jgi:hypothetical protein
MAVLWSSGLGITLPGPSSYPALCKSDILPMVPAAPPDFVTSLFLARERIVTFFDLDLAGGDPEHVAGDIGLL